MKTSKLLMVAIALLMLISAALPGGSASLTIDVSMGDVTMVEDEDAVGEFNLNDYFSSDSGQLYFSSISGDNKIEVTIHEDGSVDFSAPKDWYGSEEVTFIASDGQQEASDTILVTVKPVNDPPMLLTPIPDLPPFDEDSTLTGAVNLNTHFRDVDNALTFSYSSEFIKVAIDDYGYVDFSAPNDWYGTEEVILSASDGDFERSDSVLIAVNPVNDAPRCTVNVLSVSLNRDDSTTTLDLKDIFSDIDDADEDLTYEISGNNKINCELTPQKGQLTLHAPQDWSGEEFITLSVTDSSGETSSMQIVVITSQGVNSSGYMFYLLGLVLAFAITGARLQMVGRKRNVRSPVKLSSYRNYKL